MLSYLTLAYHSPSSDPSGIPRPTCSCTSKPTQLPFVVSGNLHRQRRRVKIFHSQPIRQQFPTKILWDRGLVATSGDRRRPRHRAWADSGPTLRCEKTKPPTGAQIITKAITEVSSSSNTIKYMVI